MQSFEFQPTTQITFGANSLDQLGTITGGFNVSHVLLVTDPGIIAAGHVNRALYTLKKEGIRCDVFSAVEENPTTEHVERGVEFAVNAGKIELIIALGGGSSMDCAKGINFLLTNDGKMEDYWGHGKADKPMLPSIGIPTTAGTGSEAQSYALISHAETHRKMACGDIKARFHHVILDPVLAESVPSEVRAVTAIDAVSHAVESYVCTRRNPISQLYAKEAWRLLEANFSAIFQTPTIEHWGNMLLGANFSGMAIENSMLGAAHATANPLTARFGITHGKAVAVMLPSVVRYNARDNATAELYRELMHAAGIATDATNSVELLVARLQELIGSAGLPTLLSDLDVSEDVLKQLAGDAAEQWTGNFNPRPVKAEELYEIYQLAYTGD